MNTNGVPSQTRWIRVSRFKIPYSVRCSPQILGAVQEALWHVESIVTRELNASTDNPLVFPPTGRYSLRQFLRPTDFDGVRLPADRDDQTRAADRAATGSAGELEIQSRPASAADRSDPGSTPVWPAANCWPHRWPPSAGCSSIPASVQTIPTNANNQDVVSMGLTSAKMTVALLPKIWTLAGIQSMALAQAADLRGDATMGADYRQLHELVRDASPKLVADRPLSGDIARVRARLQEDVVQRRFLPSRPALSRFHESPCWPPSKWRRTRHGSDRGQHGRATMNDSCEPRL